MDIPGFEKLDKCPITPGCTARLLFRHIDSGTIYRLAQREAGMTTHECKARLSEKPSSVFLGEFFNSRTGKTRYVGPARLQRSAEKTPKDDTSSPEDWKHIDTYEGTITWKSLKK